MKTILIASNNQRAYQTIREYFATEYKVISAFGKDSCLAEFRKKRHEFTFVDLDLLRELGDGSGRQCYETALKPFVMPFLRPKLL